MKAFFDCFSGISGNMTLGALIHIGVPVEWLRKQLENLLHDSFELTVSAVKRGGITAHLVEVVEKKHVHSRHWADIRDMIQKGPLPTDVADTSLAIFERIALAESNIHGVDIEQVHFHEVGGTDAIVDIVGTALCLHYLKIDSVTVSRIQLGSGFVDCAHGRLPVPAPATLAILKDVPVSGTDVPGEMVTPTGAAIVAELAAAFGPMPEMTVQGIGYGAGKRRFPDRPNLLRIVTGETGGVASYLDTDHVVIVETCIDDMNPELFGFLMERLFEDGALDVYWIPVHMKKNRPGTMIQVISPESLKETIVHRILMETTSTGVRHYLVSRSKLPRVLIWVDTTFGKVRAKQITDPAGTVRRVPEYEECKKIALDRRLPLKTVYEIIHQAINTPGETRSEAMPPNG